MIRQYIHAAMRHARYEILDDDGSFYGEIPQCPGVWANAQTLEDCREELEQVLEQWILLSLSRQLPMPVIDGVDLTVKEKESA